MQSYSFDEQFQCYKASEFATAFFTDPNVIESLETQTGKLGQAADQVDCEQLLCSVTSMRFFDRLKDLKNGILLCDNVIRKCLETYVDDFLITDKLRLMLLDKESDQYNLYSESERNQFLFCLFKHLCIGGEWCQYEDNIKQYLDITQTIYKDLISVQKEPESDMIFISSQVLKVVAKDKNGTAIFPVNPDHQQNFAYLIINPCSRRVTVLSHTYGGKFDF